MSFDAADRCPSEVQAQIHYRLLEQSAASERRYRILIEHLQDPVFQLDGSRTLTFVNAAWCETIGLEQSESLGRELASFVDPHDLGKIRAAFDALDDPSEGGAVSVEFRVLRECGTPLEVECSLQRSVDSDVIGSLRDLTRHKLLEERLRAARDAAEAASRLKSSFLANMSHEIRTPLGAVLGFTEILGEDDLDETGRREYARLVQRNGNHLLALVDDILDLSKIESGKLEIREEPFELCELVEDVVTVCSDEIRAKGLEMSTEWSGSEWPGGDFVSDPMRVRQILSNLLCNAVKFTHEGSIALEVNVDADDRIVSFVVADTGLGIAPDRLASIFEPFRQAEQDITRRFGGTGLGLTISSRLAALLGGQLSVESELGRGSRFRLELPLRMHDGPTTPSGEATASRGRAPSRSSSNPQAGRESSFGGRRVLLVEDTADLRRLMLRFLESFGVEVDAVTNGEEAAERIGLPGDEGGGYDMVLMDMQMPVMDGYTATRTLRQRGYEGLVVALTAYAMSGDRRKCLEAGCDDYLAKPVSRATICDLFERHFGPVESS